MADQGKLQITHSFVAKPEVIFKAWTTPSLMQKWLDGGENVDISHTSCDLRVGGRFEITMQGRLLHHGEYQKIVPPRLLVFTWNSHVTQESLVTVELVARGEHTDLTLTHERLPEDMVQAHTIGWTRIMGHLTRLLAKGE